MRRLSTVLALTLLFALALAPAVRAGPPSFPFTGDWIGHDPAPPDGDGSTVHLVITGGPSVRILFTDEFGSVCVNEGATGIFFSSILNGKVEGSVLNATFKVARCGTTIIDFLRGEPAKFEYDGMGTTDLGDDTLWDGSVLWHRDS